MIPTTSKPVVCHKVGVPRETLVPKEDGKRFCDKVNEGREPRSQPHGFFYLRRGDWGKKVTGLPNVPDAWKSFLQKKPA